MTAAHDYDRDVPIDVDEEPPVLDGIEQAVRMMARRHRVMRDAADLDAARAARQALIDADQADLDAWTADRMAGISRALDWHDRALISWHRAILADDPRAKTIDLAGLGKLQARKQTPEWDIDDPTFLAWATVHRPDLVRIPEPKPAVDRAAVKKAFAVADGAEGEQVPALQVIADVDHDTGEIVEHAIDEPVPGVHVTRRGVRHQVVAEGVDL